MAGRPTKMLPLVVEAILNGLRQSMPEAAAAAAAGIHPATFSRWKSENAAFREAVEKAEWEGVSRQVKVVFDAAPKNWQAAAWLLERRHSEIFGRKDRIEMMVDLRKLAAEIAQDGFDEDAIVAEAEAIVSGR